MPVQATSEAQQEAFLRRAVPPVEEVAPGVHSIALAMPGMPIPFSLSYVIRDQHARLHVIDLGMDSDDNWMAFSRALAEIGHDVSDIVTLTLTHAHDDHSGLAWRVAERGSASIRMHHRDVTAMQRGAPRMAAHEAERALIGWGVPPAMRDVVRAGAASPVAALRRFDVDCDYSVATVGDSDPVSGLRVVHTPGHTRGHLTVVDEARQLIFTGDHVLPVIYPGAGMGGVSAGDDPIGDHLKSLDALAPFANFEVCPGHGYRFRGLRDRCAEMSQRYIDRATIVATMLEDRPEATVWEVAERVRWSVPLAEMTPVRMYSALAQTAERVARAQAARSETSLRVRNRNVSSTADDRRARRQR